MIPVNILVEGQTEERFVKDLLNPFFEKHDIFMIPIIISTKRIRSGMKFKGGLLKGNYNMFIKELNNLINSTPQGLVSTFIDYYALPTKFPGYDERIKYHTQREKVEFLECELYKSLGSPQNFIPYIQLHEFETFLFSDKTGFQNCLDIKKEDLNKLFEIIDKHKNPEDINEGEYTAPSKRILKVYDSYDKVVDGNQILKKIGIEVLIDKCPHFNNFIEKVKCNKYNEIC